MGDLVNNWLNFVHGLGFRYVHDCCVGGKRLAVLCSWLCWDCYFGRLRFACTPLRGERSMVSDIDRAHLRCMICVFKSSHVLVQDHGCLISTPSYYREHYQLSEMDMYECMYACINAIMYVCLCVYMYLCMYVCVQVNVCIRLSTFSLSKRDLLVYIFLWSRCLN